MGFKKEKIVNQQKCTQRVYLAIVGFKTNLILMLLSLLAVDSNFGQIKLSYIEVGNSLQVWNLTELLQNQLINGKKIQYKYAILKPPVSSLATLLLSPLDLRIDRVAKMPGIKTISLVLK
jgi:hypothetical protein